MDMVHLRKKKGWRAGTATATVLLATLLSACGGSDDDSSSPSTQQFGALGGKKTLIVHVDGLAIAPLQTALSAHPTLQTLGAPLVLRSGGYAGSASEQQTDALPSWASLLTGAWSIEHGMGSVLPEGGQALKIATVFDWLKQSNPQLQTALIVSNPAYVEALQANVEAGDIDVLPTCSNDDACVTEQSQAAVTQGADFIVAQYDGLLAVASEHGLGAAEYQQHVQKVLTDMESFMALIAEREALASDESWQVLVVNSYGMDEFGTVTGSQFERNKTGWLLSTIDLSETVTAQDDPTRGVLDHAAIIDVVPTVLAEMEVVPSAGVYPFNGNDLRNPVQLAKVEYDYDQKAYSLALEWTLYSDEQFSAPIEIYREGQLLASVDATARHYVDTMIPSGSDDALLPLRYELRTQGGAASVQSIIVPPPLLSQSIAQGLVTYYPFKNTNVDDLKQSSTLSAWNQTASGQSWVTTPGDLPYRVLPENAGSAALTMDISVYQQGGLAGYRMDMHSPDVTMDASVEAFTIGFWFKTDGTCEAFGTPMLANKNYGNKSGDGMVIGLFTPDSAFMKDMCGVRFNTGDGRQRDELRGFSISAGEWAYVAMAVDKTNKQLYGYVIDPKAGQQNAQMPMADARIQALSGENKQLFGLGNDATGDYYKRFKYEGVKSYSDVAVWNRLLTVDEVKNIYASRSPLFSLHP